MIPNWTELKGPESELELKRDKANPEDMRPAVYIEQGNQKMKWWGAEEWLANQGFHKDSALTLECAHNRLSSRE